MRKLARLAASPWVRAIVTLSLLGLVASGLDWSLIADTPARRATRSTSLLAVALVVLALVVGAWRWRALLHRAGVPLGLSRLARIYAVSTFSATFLPSTAGGDVSRALLVARRGPELRRAVVSILVDRAGGLAGMVGLAWIALALAPDRVPGAARTLLVWSTVALVLGGVAVLVAMLRGSRLLRRAVPQRLMATAQRRACRPRRLRARPALARHLARAEPRLPGADRLPARGARPRDRRRAVVRDRGGRACPGDADHADPDLDWRLRRARRLLRRAARWRVDRRLGRDAHLGAVGRDVARREPAGRLDDHARQRRRRPGGAVS